MILDPPRVSDGNGKLYWDQLNSDPVFIIQSYRMGKTGKLIRSFFSQGKPVQFRIMITGGSPFLEIAIANTYQEIEQDYSFLAQHIRPKIIENRYHKYLTTKLIPQWIHELCNMPFVGIDGLSIPEPGFRIEESKDLKNISKWSVTFSDNSALLNFADPTNVAFLSRKILRSKSLLNEYLPVGVFTKTPYPYIASKKLFKFDFPQDFQYRVPKKSTVYYFKYDDEQNPGFFKGEWVAMSEPPKSLTDILDTKSRYLWVIDRRKNLIIGDEAPLSNESSKRNTLKHADIVETSTEKVRGPARLGGELYFDEDLQRFVLNNDSSYMFNRVDGEKCYNSNRYSLRRVQDFDLQNWMTPIQTTLLSCGLDIKNLTIEDMVDQKKGVIYQQLYNAYYTFLLSDHMEEVKVEYENISKKMEVQFTGDELDEEITYLKLEKQPLMIEAREKLATMILRDYSPPKFIPLYKSDIEAIMEGHKVVQHENFLVRVLQPTSTDEEEVKINKSVFEIVTESYNQGAYSFYDPPRKNKVGTLESFLDEAAKSYTYFVSLSLKGEVLGTIRFARYEHDQRAIFVSSLCVRQQMKGKGIGKKFTSFIALRTMLYCAGVIRANCTVNSVNTFLFHQYLKSGLIITGKEKYPDGPNGIRYKDKRTGEEVYSICLAKFCIPTKLGITMDFTKLGVRHYFENFKPESINVIGVK